MKVISLFSGAGGLDIGFEQAGFEVVVAVEKDPSCCNTLRKNRPNLKVIEGDVSMLTGKQILQEAGIKKTEPALVIGGPPCQSFSLAGKRLGMDDMRGQLIFEFSRIVHELLPVGFVMENVKGMLNWEKGKAIEAIINELRTSVRYRKREYHYNVSYDILNAAQFGLPQHRERLFIVGNRIGVDYSFPEPEYGENPTPDLYKRELKPYKTVWDAIGKLPKADEPSETAKRVSQTIKGRIAKHGY